MYRRRPGAVVGVQERDERDGAVRGVHLHGVVQRHRAHQRRLHAHDVGHQRGGHRGAVDRCRSFKPGVESDRVVRVEMRQEVRHHVGALVVEPIDDEAGETTHALDRAELRRHGRPPRATTVARARGFATILFVFFFHAKNLMCVAPKTPAPSAFGSTSRRGRRAHAWPPRLSRGAFPVRGRERRIVTCWSFLGHKPSFATTRLRMTIYFFSPLSVFFTRSSVMVGAGVERGRCV